MNTKSQREMILGVLSDFQPHTIEDIRERIYPNQKRYCFRIPARISELKLYFGYDIRTFGTKGKDYAYQLFPFVEETINENEK